MTRQRSQLHGYQNRMVEWIKDKPRCALYADMGLGKTVATLTALVDLFNAFEIARVLIVGPQKVMTDTWPEEIQSWEHTKHLSFAQLTGLSVRKRSVLCLHDTSQIHLISRDLLHWLVHFLKKKWPYDVVVVDESSSLKSAESQRFKALNMVNHAIGIDRIIELTGTPTSVGLIDLWSQIYLLDMGRRLGYSEGAYKNRYFYSNPDTGRLSVRGNSESIIHDKLKDLCLRLDAADYLKMPEKVITDVSVTLPDSVRKAYAKKDREFTEETQKADFSRAAVSMLSNQMLQICNGAVYTDGKAWEPVHDKKLEALDTIIAESYGEPIFVVYRYIHDKERMLARYKGAEAVGKDSTTIKRWNEGSIPLLLAHPLSAGYGLNLQRGGRIMVWFGLPWASEQYLQSNARLWRQGQEKPVFIYRIRAKNSIEDKVVDVLEGRVRIQDRLLEALKGDEDIAA